MTLIEKFNICYLVFCFIKNRTEEDWNKNAFFGGSGYKKKKKIQPKLGGG